MLSTPSRLRTIRGLTAEQRAAIHAYIQGMVYSWAKNCPGREFAARDLVGGANFDSRRTPLIVLYDRHVRMGKDNETAIADAGKDLGWLMKSVLAADKRTFTTRRGRVCFYRWDGVGP